MAAMTKELKAKLAEYSKQKRKERPLLKDIEPWLLPLYACDHYNEHRDDPGFNHSETFARDGEVYDWAYLSRASAEQVAALAEHLPHKRVIVGSRIGNRIVTVFSEARLRYALDQLRVDHKGRWSGLLGDYRSKYVRRVNRKRMTEATKENVALWVM